MANSGLNLFYDLWGGILMEMLEHVSIAHDYQTVFQKIFQSYTLPDGANKIF